MLQNYVYFDIHMTCYITNSLIWTHTLVSFNILEPFGIHSLWNKQDIRDEPFETWFFLGGGIEKKFMQGQLNKNKHLVK